MSHKRSREESPDGTIGRKKTKLNNITRLVLDLHDTDDGSAQMTLHLLETSAMMDGSKPKVSKVFKPKMRTPIGDVMEHVVTKVESLHLTKSRSSAGIEVTYTEVPKLPEYVATHGLTRQAWEKLEASRKRVPRFLFRCFGRYSGGDTKLNTTSGIIPRGFLNGSKPTNMYMIKDLKRMIIDHLSFSTTETQFSSWAATTHYAEAHASDATYIAIIDRTLLAPHVKIYHFPELREAGLCDGPDGKPAIVGCNGEYLAYGPIEGSAFHCVSNDYDKFARLYEPLLHVHPTSIVYRARRIAEIFRLGNDDRPDIVIALTVLFSCSHFRNFTMERAKILDKNLFVAVVSLIRSELRRLKLPPAGSNDLTPINPEMYIGPDIYAMHLEQTVVLWKCIEERLRLGDI
ncbi:uncharacterized protein F4812DRAFT_454030 [Daldinia caldariorum]|uniref:uncharacterized protein n=1 Tax=Daldinia caldariorum TaxID=326644 RepID=UPI002007FA5D|nr:uncharacterized protein F4812DRAFT_454030 [Daldinia caldariorum]KAI1472221.1 hypothetical protein F4812DRAFT_454030 [Daldinia caldariorum]